MPPFTDFILNGTSLGVAFMAFRPTVATRADGRAFMAWVSLTQGTCDSYHQAEIRGRWFNAGGTPSGEDFVVNTTTDDCQWRPTAATSADGTVTVTWDSADEGDGDGNAFAVP